MAISRSTAVDIILASLYKHKAVAPVTVLTHALFMKRHLGDTKLGKLAITSAFLTKSPFS